MNGKNLTLTIIGFLLGIVGIVLAWYGWYFVIALAGCITGIVLTSLVIKESKNAAAIAGLAFNILGIVFCFIGAFITFIRSIV